MMMATMILPIILSVAVLAWLVSPVLATPLVGFGGIVGLVTRRVVINWPLIGTALGVIGLLGLSLLWSVHVDVSMERAAKVTGLILGCALLLMVRPGSAGYWLIISYALFLMVILFDFTNQGLIFRTVLGEELLRFSVYNKALILMALLLPFLSLWLWRAGQKRTMIALVVLYALACFNSVSSTAMVMLVCLPFLLALFYCYPRIGLGVGFLFYALAALVVPFYMPLIADVAMQSFPEFMTLASIGARLEIASAITPMVQAHPFLGQGLEIVRMQEGLMSGYTFFPYESVLHPHNMIMQLWAELGLLGIVAHLLLLGMVVLAAFKNTDRLGFATIMAAVFMALFMLNTSFGIWQSWLMTSLTLVVFLAKCCLRPYKMSPQS